MNVGRLFEGFISSGVAGGLAGGAASGLLVQSLSSKKGKKIAGNVLKLGGAAVVGGLAWKAYQQYQQNSAGNTPAPSAEPAITNSWETLQKDQFLPANDTDAAYQELLVLRAMISAAHADGHIDGSEKLKIFERLEQSGLSQTEKGLLMEELSAPLPMHVLADQARSPALAAEVYMASLIMIDQANGVNRQYLDQLSFRLNLPPQLVSQLQLQAAPQPVVALTHAQVA
jgi:uncharacterized membrane protein YebE (DUF533 family)